MLLLAVDVGNSSIKFGIFASADLLDRFSIPTRRDYSVEEFDLERLTQSSGSPRKYDAAIVASVVPELDDVLRNAFRHYLNVEPRFVDQTYDFGFEIAYDPPSSVGVDRLVNASAAAKKYGVPVIACSFGTAAIFDVVDADRRYIGGAIAPGPGLLAAALHQRTSKLPAVEVAEAETAIGHTTLDSLRSGIYYGFLGSVEGILERMCSELGSKPTVVATGGHVHLVADKVRAIDRVDETLTLDGLRMLATGPAE